MTFKPRRKPGSKLKTAQQAKLDLDPRIDLTKPIYKQVEELNDSPALRSASVDDPDTPYQRIREAVELIETLWESKELRGSMRLEIQENGIRVWWRIDEERFTDTTSWRVLETSITNPLVASIRQVMTAKRVRDANKHRIKGA